MLILYHARIAWLCVCVQGECRPTWPISRRLQLPHRCRHARTEVEGYDPEGMYDRYLQCRDSITHGESGSRNPVWRDWEHLSPEEQASYAEPTGGDAYNSYLAHRIVQEMSTRDRQWLYDGTVPQYEIEDGLVHQLEKKILQIDLQSMGTKAVFAL